MTNSFMTTSWIESVSEVDEEIYSKKLPISLKKSDMNSSTNVKLRDLKLLCDSKEKSGLKKSPSKNQENW